MGTDNQLWPVSLVDQERITVSYRGQTCKGSITYSLPLNAGSCVRTFNKSYNRILLCTCEGYCETLLSTPVRCVPYSFLQSNVILIHSTTYPGPFYLSNSEIFGCDQDPFLRRPGTLEKPFFQSYSGVAGGSHVQ